MNPYSRFQSLRTFLMVSGMTLTFAAARFFQDRVPKSGEALIEYVLLIMYGLVPILIWAITFHVVMPMILEKSFFRRLILGRRYIEGTWIQWANEPGHKRGLSIIQIEPDRDGFAAAGVHHTIEEYQVGDFGKPFKIECIRFEWPTLHCECTTHPIPGGGETPDYKVLAFYTFHGIDGLASDFVGRYFYVGPEGAATFGGRRATKEELNELRLDWRGTSLIQKLIKEAPTLTTRS